MTDRRPKLTDALSYPPRGMSRDEAARYIGVSPTKFDRMIADKEMPKPKQLGGRVVWDRFALDMAFSALPEQGGAGEDFFERLFAKQKR
jgi:excisionase family DNA binding protein